MARVPTSPRLKRLLDPVGERCQEFGLSHGFPHLNESHQFAPGRGGRGVPSVDGTLPTVLKLSALRMAVLVPPQFGYPEAGVNVFLVDRTARQVDFDCQ